MGLQSLLCQVLVLLEVGRRPLPHGLRLLLQPSCRLLQYGSLRPSGASCYSLTMSTQSDRTVYLVTASSSKLAYAGVAKIGGL